MQRLRRNELQHSNPCNNHNKERQARPSPHSSGLVEPDQAVHNPDNQRSNTVVRSNSIMQRTRNRSNNSSSINNSKRSSSSTMGKHHSSNSGDGKLPEVKVGEESDLAAVEAAEEGMTSINSIGVAFISVSVLSWILDLYSPLDI